MRRRAAPLVATAALLVIGMNYTILWNGVVHGNSGVWLTPSDLWGTYVASVALVHGHLTSAYVGLPGSVLITAPPAALGDALRLQVGPNYAAFAAPTGWLLMAPYVIVMSAPVLFAADRIAEYLDVTRHRRMALALAEAFVVANVSLKWGHPEDALSVALLLFAALDVVNGRWRRGGWLLGAGIAVQPFAVLALPALLTVVAVRERRQLPWLVARSLIPIGVLLVPALVFDWHEATQWIIHQPNFPAFNHATPWTSLASRAPGRFYAVSAGPGRLIGLVVGAAVAVVVCRRQARRVDAVLWTVAVAFWLWLVFESVIDSYYTWPVLAITLLLCARRSAWHLAAGAVLAIFVTWFSNVVWAGIWPWWTILLLALGSLLVLCWPGKGSTDSLPLSGADSATVAASARGSSGQVLRREHQSMSEVPGSRP
jgi:hypothetical protein